MKCVLLFCEVFVHDSDSKDLDKNSHNPSEKKKVNIYFDCSVVSIIINL